jgi:hypothetical protein
MRRIISFQMFMSRDLPPPMQPNLARPYKRSVNVESRDMHLDSVELQPLFGWSSSPLGSLSWRPDRPTGRHDGPMFLGEDLLQWLLLALGAALFAGNLMAVVRPPERQREEGNLERAPVGRSLLYAGLGLVAAVWALASLISG